MSTIWVDDDFPRDLLIYKRRVALDAAVRNFPDLWKDSMPNNIYGAYNLIYALNRLGFADKIRAEFRRLMDAA